MNQNFCSRPRCSRLRFRLPSWSRSEWRSAPSLVITTWPTAGRGHLYLRSGPRQRARGQWRTGYRGISSLTRINRSLQPFYTSSASRIARRVNARSGGSARSLHQSYRRSLVAGQRNRAGLQKCQAPSACILRFSYVCVADAPFFFFPVFRRTRATRRFASLPRAYFFYSSPVGSGGRPRALCRRDCSLLRALRVRNDRRRRADSAEGTS